MIRPLVFILSVFILSAWIIRERPELFYSMIMNDSVRSIFQGRSGVTTELVPGLTQDSLPILPENHSLSVLFQPVLRSYAAHLSVPTAHASIIMDAETGKILFANNERDHRQIASLTKLLTALITVEQISDLDALVVIDEEEIYAEGTRVGCPRSGYCPGVRFQVGEKVSVRDLLQAALMQSANDAAIALGKNLGGTQAGFAKIMNERAKELGMTDSHFCTPSGLEIDGEENNCYSSAHDIALVAAEALKYPEIWKIMTTKKATITSSDGLRSHDLFNTDELIGAMPNLIGTKTGFTPLAGYSLLAVANDPTGLHPVIAVVLNDPYRWESIRSMFDWSFSSFDWI